MTVENAVDGEDMTNPAVEAMLDEAQRGGFDDDPEFHRAYRDHAEGALVVSALLKDYLAKNPKSRTTEANYATTVRLWIDHRGDRSLREVRRSQALEWLNAVAKDKARDTIKRYVAVMSNLWLWSFRAVDRRPANPFEGLAQAGDERGREAQGYGHFSDDELVRAYAAVWSCPASVDGLRVRTA